MPEKKKNNKDLIEMNLMGVSKKKFEDISNKKSVSFYFSIALVHIFVLFVVFFYLKSSDKVVDFSNFIELLQFQHILLLIFVFVLILALNSLQLSLRLYSKTRKFKYFSMCRNVAKSKFYGVSTIYGAGEKYCQLAMLSAMKINDKTAVNLTYGKKYSQDIAKCIYGIIIMFLGTFLWLEKSFILLYIIGFVLLIISLLITSVRLIFNKNKQLAIKIVARFGKFLYDMKLIHDFDSYYNNVMDNIVIYNKSFKHNKWLVVFEIICDIFVYFLKGFVLYLILFALNIADLGVLGQILFKAYILQIALDIYPLQRGLGLLEILFMLLFENVFFDGYVFYALILYKIFDYFMYIVQYLIIKAIEISCDLLSKKVLNKNE